MKGLFFLLLLLACCSSPKKTTRFEGVAMTIPYSIQIGDAIDAKKKVQIEMAIFAVFREVNEILNNWNPHSEISHLNRVSAFEKVKLSPLLGSFLQEVDQLVRLTEGRFDPTVRKDGQNEAVGWQKIHLEDGFFWKEHPQTTLDLCGASKGYAVDLIVERLQKLNLQSIYVEWGGEIKTLGLHPQKRNWKIEIYGRDIQLELKNKALATSGNYWQKWDLDGKTVTHIINPFTKKAVEVTPSSVSSVSVLCETCAEADAIATALMIFPSVDSANEWANQRGIKAWIY